MDKKSICLPKHSGPIIIGPDTQIETDRKKRGGREISIFKKTGLAGFRIGRSRRTGGAYV